MVRNLDVNIGKLLVKTVQIRYQIVAADRVAGSNAQLASIQGMGLQKLVFPFSDQVSWPVRYALKEFRLQG